MIFDAEKGPLVENKGLLTKKIELFHGISYFYPKLELFGRTLELIDYWSFFKNNWSEKKIASVSKISYFQQ